LAFSSYSSHTKVNNSQIFSVLDRSKTDSHRFKPNSRKILINEQLNH